MTSITKPFAWFSVVATLALCGANVPVAAEEAALFRLDGTEYTDKELSPGVRQALYNARLAQYQTRQAVLDDAVLEIYFRAEAERQGKEMVAFVSEQLSVPEPDVAAVRKFFDDNQARIRRPFEQVSGRIAQHLQQLGVEQKKKALLLQVKSRMNFELLEAAPVAPVHEIASDGFPSRGDENAKVTVVEFADYQCPHCKNAGEAMKRVLERYKGKARWVYIDFPINPSGISRQVAEGAACAAKQDKYWEFHELAFEQQPELDKDSPLALAEEVGLDEAKFKECMASADANSMVAKAEREAMRLGLDSTPSLFVNGRRVKFQDDWEGDIAREIDAALKGGDS